MIIRSLTLCLSVLVLMSCTQNGKDSRSYLKKASSQVFDLQVEGEGEIVASYTVVDGVTSEWSRVTISPCFENPVIIAKAATANESDPFQVSYKGPMCNDGDILEFQIKLQEFSFSDGVHGAESVVVFVAKPGRHELNRGFLEAGTVNGFSEYPSDISTPSFDGHPNMFLVTGAGDIFHSMAELAEGTVPIITQDSSPNWAHGPFQAQIQPEPNAPERASFGSVINYIGFPYNADFLQTSVFRSIYVRPELAVTYPITDSSGSTRPAHTIPHAFLGMAYSQFNSQDNRGPDGWPSYVQFQFRSPNEIWAKLVPVVSGEPSNAVVEIYKLSIFQEREGVVRAKPVPVEEPIVSLPREDTPVIASYKVIDQVASGWKPVSFNYCYADPVVIAQALSRKGPDPFIVRYRNPICHSDTNFEIEVKLEEFRNADGGHMHESIVLLVAERGRHSLPNGGFLEAGTIEIASDTPTELVVDDNSHDGTITLITTPKLEVLAQDEPVPIIRQTLPDPEDGSRFQVHVDHLPIWPEDTALNVRADYIAFPDNAAFLKDFKAGNPDHRLVDLGAFPEALGFEPTEVANAFLVGQIRPQDAVPGYISVKVNDSNRLLGQVVDAMTRAPLPFTPPEVAHVAVLPSWEGDILKAPPDTQSAYALLGDSLRKVNYIDDPSDPDYALISEDFRIAKDHLVPVEDFAANTERVANLATLWPFGIVPYRFVDIPPVVEAFLRGEMGRFSHKVAERIIFRPYNQDTDNRKLDIRIDYESPYCGVATYGPTPDLGEPKTQTITFNSLECVNRRVIAHELMHIVGFVHEHQRSIRSRHVTINFSNIPESLHFSYRQIPAAHLRPIELERPFDFQSVLLYSGGSADRPTIIRKDTGEPTIAAPWLSDEDAVRMMQVYQDEYEKRAGAVDDVDLPNGSRCNNCRTQCRSQTWRLSNGDRLCTSRRVYLNLSTEGGLHTIYKFQGIQVDAVSTFGERHTTSDGSWGFDRNTDSVFLSSDTNRDYARTFKLTFPSGRELTRIRYVRCADADNGPPNSFTRRCDDEEELSWGNSGVFDVDPEPQGLQTPPVTLINPDSPIFRMITTNQHHEDVVRCLDILAYYGQGFMQDCGNAGSASHWYYKHVSDGSPYITIHSELYGDLYCLKAVERGGINTFRLRWCDRSLRRTWWRKTGAGQPYKHRISNVFFGEDQCLNAYGGGNRWAFLGDCTRRSAKWTLEGYDTPAYVENIWHIPKRRLQNAQRTDRCLSASSNLKNYLIPCDSPYATPWYFLYDRHDYRYFRMKGFHIDWANKCLISLRVNGIESPVWRVCGQYPDREWWYAQGSGTRVSIRNKKWDHSNNQKAIDVFDKSPHRAFLNDREHNENHALWNYLSGWPDTTGRSSAAQYNPTPTSVQAAD